MELTFLYIDCLSGLFMRLFSYFIWDFGYQIVKLTENENGLVRLENNRGFTVDIKQQNKSNMQAPDLKFWMNTHFNAAHLKISTVLQKTWNSEKVTKNMISEKSTEHARCCLWNVFKQTKLTPVNSWFWTWLIKMFLNNFTRQVQNQLFTGVRWSTCYETFWEILKQTPTIEFFEKFQAWAKLYCFL